MLPVVIHVNKRIFRYYTGFSFFIFIWISRLERDEPRLVRHEKIHFWQQLELLFVLHWLLYLFFYLLMRLYGQPHYIAYRYSPLEMEAYDHDQQLDYCRNRKLFAWIKYLPKYRAMLKQNLSALVPKRKEISF